MSGLPGSVVLLAWRAVLRIRQRLSPAPTQLSRRCSHQQRWLSLDLVELVVLVALVAVPVVALVALVELRQRLEALVLR
jgi:anti-sigma-K factor RskA